MMLRAVSLLALMLVLVVSGCAQVATVAPVGEHPKKLSPEDWNGTWIHKEQPVKIMVTDPQQGVLQVAWVEEKRGCLEMESYQVEIWEAGAWTFGNLRVKDSPGAPYHWGLVKNEEGQIIFWSPDHAYVRKLVEQGVLPGNVAKGGDVVLKKLTAEQIKTIMSPARSECFNWMKPTVFMRLGK